MKNKKYFFLFSILSIGSLMLSACGSLLSQAEQAVQGDYGPKYTAQEHQNRTFEALWGDLEKYYIHYDSDKVDWKVIHDKYTSKINSGLTDAQFIQTMQDLGNELPAGALVYQSRNERITADTTDLSTYEGIGAIVGFQKQDQPHIVILDVVAGSPAEKAGLKPHDSIYKIDGNPILANEGLTVVNRIRGPAGSTVTIDVKSPDQTERTLKVTRGKLSSTGAIEHHQISGTQYGYILFPPISYANMNQDVLDSLKDFTTNQKLSGLILDLRVAGVSGSWPLQDLLSLFYKGKVGDYYDRTNQTQPLTAQGQNYMSSQTIPLVILIGSNTGGDPEILAAGLQATKRATIIGASSLGSVETTGSFYLPDGSRIFTEIVSFKLSNGKEIGDTGIQPDIVINTGWDNVQPDADPVINKAVEILDTKK